MRHADLMPEPSPELPYGETAQIFRSPSAAKHVTGGAINGWVFWSVEGSEKPTREPKHDKPAKAKKERAAKKWAKSKAAPKKSAKTKRAKKAKAMRAATQHANEVHLS